MITERAAPKVNLTLRILGRRADGYHELESLVAFAHDVADTVTLEPSAETRLVTTVGAFAEGIAGTNLISVTLERIHGSAPHLLLGDVVLSKQLPVAAGIGGGSADAAAVIRAVRRLNGAVADDIDWRAIAVSVGADVPVCLASKAQVMRGVGEQLEDMPAMPALAVVLVNPRVSVPEDKTVRVFRALKAAPLSTHAPMRGTPPTFPDTRTLLAHMAAIGNDLTPAARGVVPAIDQVLAALHDTPGCRLAQLSGGGPTCFGAFDTMDLATAAAAAISGAHPTWWVAPSMLG